jgi:hypothetical protein
MSIKSEEDEMAEKLTKKEFAKIAALKAECDEVITVDEFVARYDRLIPSPADPSRMVPTMQFFIGMPHIGAMGYYAWQDSTTKKKTFVEA